MSKRNTMPDYDPVPSQRGGASRPPKKKKKKGEEAPEKKVNLQITDKGVVAVQEFNLDIADREFIVLVGPSGCGKSTTLRMVAGLEDITSGELWIGDKLMNDVEPKDRDIAMVFQNYALYPHLTVEQNILFPLENRKGKDKLSKAEMLRRAQEAAKLVQIDGLMERKPSELSGGQQQRVAIARALVKMPRVLLLDEPLSNLDARLRLQTREEIRRIQKATGITTIFVTHDQEEAMSISDCIVVMKAGVIHQIGKPQQVYDDPVNLFVAKFLGTPPINVFDGEVRGGTLYLGEDAVMQLRGAADGKVTVGIRPEGFVPDPEGTLKCGLLNVEVMGRDVSVVGTHPAFQGAAIRAIIASDAPVSREAAEVRFRLKPHKVLLFDPQTERRIPFQAV